MFEQKKFVDYMLSQSGVGNMSLVKLYRIFPRFENLVKNFEKNDQISTELKKNIFRALNNENEIKDSMITLWDEEYPALLKQIYDPPARIFYKGNIKVFEKVGISIVGTRKASSYGNKVTKHLIEYLSEYPVCSLSGMAFGVDSVVHLESLKNNLSTIAVLGSSLQNITPKSNQYLFEEIVDKGGVALSEYAPNTKIVPGMFASRNRIIAGFSKVTIIIEAGEKSGALITAQLALENNREVFAVPGQIFSEFSKGCNKIIASGEACLLHDFSQILNALNIGIKFKNLNDKNLKLTEDQQKIIEIFSKNNVLSPDEVGRLSGKSNFLSILSELELLGVIERNGGKYTLA